MKFSKILEKLVKAPAVSLDNSIRDTLSLEKKLLNKKPLKAAEEYWNTLGPGLTTGAADDDPSGIATYSQTGAIYGFQLLWLALYTFPLMSVVQEMCARIGLVTGTGLAANIKQHYPRWVLYTATSLLFIANTFNLGADLGAMAKGVELLFPEMNFAFLVILFAVVSLMLQIFTTYARYAKYLKYMALVLFSYIFSALLIHLDWKTILTNAVVPSITFSREQIFLICGILGTTISPYLFFWQTSQEVEQEVLAGKTTLQMRREITEPQIKSMHIDVWSGMFISNLVMFFIIVACAATIFSQQGMVITTAADAAQALKPFAGNFAYLLFAIGIIGTGMLAVPVLAGSASYAISESFGWKTGLYRKLNKAYSFYGVIIISMAIGLGLNFAHIDPIKALIYSAVANGIIAPVILFLIVRISGSKKIMGQWANGKLTNFLGWLITGIMVIAGVAVLVSLIFP